MKTVYGTELKCPRCNGKEFDEHESGADSYDDDITYTSYSCKNCQLWYSDWTHKWYVNCDHWQEEEPENEYDPTNKLVITPIKDDKGNVISFTASGGSNIKELLDKFIKENEADRYD